MGYRSEVAMAIYGEPEAMNDIISYFDEEFEKLSVETKEYIKHGINIAGNKIIIHYDSIKWYEYEDFFKRVWHYANFESDGINGEYIIIGEALDEVEEESFGDSPVWILSLNRSISINTGDDN